MRKKLINLVLMVTLLVVAFYSCGSKKESEQTTQEQTRQEQIDELKKELKDVDNSIGELFQQEQENFKEAANKVLSEMNWKIDSLRSQLPEIKEEADLKNKLENLRTKADSLRMKINQMDQKVIEQQAESQEDLKEKFNNLKKDIVEITEKY